MDKKRKKVEFQSKQFLSKWTRLYCFILPNRSEALPVYLICHQTVDIFKVFNIKFHHELSHKSFIKHFPVNGELYKQKIKNLLIKYTSVTNILSHAMSEQHKICLNFLEYFVDTR